MTHKPEHESYSPHDIKIAKTFDDMLDQCQGISKSDLHRLQNAALENILRHAWKTTPFYADRLAPLFGRDETIDLSAWQDIPILSRHDLQNNFDTLNTTDYPAAHGKIGETKSSGSTGEPVRVLSTQFTRLAALAVSARSMRWAAIDYTLTQAQVIPAVGKGFKYPGKKIESSWAPFWLGDIPSGAWYQLDHTTPHLQLLKWLSERGRCYLNTIAGNARQLALLAAKHPEYKLDLAGILTVSELVSDDLRQLVRDNLDCEIHDAYSSTEFGSIAAQCSQNTNLHVADELFLLEIIDETTGKPVAAGETGAVVITSFYNYAMPLIRYKMGDLAMRGAPCECGRSLSVITEIVGRQRQIFRFPGGITVMPGLATAIFYKFLKAQKWQIAQIGEKTIEVRFVSDAPLNEQDREAFIAAADNRFPLKLDYEFKQLETMPNLPSGKFFEYICELPDNEI